MFKGNESHFLTSIFLMGQQIDVYNIFHGQNIKSLLMKHSIRRNEMLLDFFICYVKKSAFSTFSCIYIDANKDEWG